MKISSLFVTFGNYHINKFAYLITKKELPSVKSKANFLALNNNTGMYINEMEKQSIPIPTHMTNIVIR